MKVDLGDQEEILTRKGESDVSFPRSPLCSAVSHGPGARRREECLPRSKGTRGRRKRWKKGELKREA